MRAEIPSRATWGRETDRESEGEGEGEGERQREQERQSERDRDLLARHLKGALGKRSKRVSQPPIYMFF